MRLDTDDMWEDSRLMDGEMDGEEDWADGDTTFSEADMSIGSEVAAPLRRWCVRRLLAVWRVTHDFGRIANDTLCDEPAHETEVGLGPHTLILMTTICTSRFVPRGI